MQLNTKIRILINNIYKNKNNIKKKYKKSVDGYILWWYSITCPWDEDKTFEASKSERATKAEKSFLKKELTNNTKFVKLKKLKRAKQLKKLSKLSKWTLKIKQ